MTVHRSGINLCRKCRSLSERLKGVTHAKKTKEQNRECYDRINTGSGVAGRLRVLTWRARSSAKVRGVYVHPDYAQGRKFDLDLMRAYEKQDGLCALTGVVLLWREPYGISIDRIDNNLGYIPGNVQLVTRDANSGKGRGVEDSPSAMLSVITRGLSRFPELRPIVRSVLDFYNEPTA